MISLYLLSHQDDEIGVMHDIATAPVRDERAFCVFLTDGAFDGVKSETRNRESLRVLMALGVAEADIHFLGEQLGIGDGRLVEHLDGVLPALEALCRAAGSVRRIVMHAWEGGHHDHDAAHLVGRALAERAQLRSSSRQFCLYRAGEGTRDLVFAAPQSAHGAVEETHIPQLLRWRYLALLRHYRSQARVMARLGPHLVRAYLIEGTQKLQHLPDAGILGSRPASRLLYEQWGLYGWDRFDSHARGFVGQHFAGPAGVSVTPAARST